MPITLAGFLAYCGVEAVKALTLAAGVFYLATCFPLRRLLERYVSPLAAAWGCVLYVCAPKLIRFYCAPLLDSAKTFFLIAAVLYFLRSTEEPKAKNAILLGVSAGLLAAARGEGILLTAAMLAGYLFFVLIFRRNAAWKKQFAALITAVICAIAVLTPFCAMNYSKSGYFVTDARIAYVIQSKLAPAAPQATAAEKATNFVTYSNDLSEKKTLSHDISSFIRGSYELYLILALLGMPLIIKKREWRSDYWLLIGLTAMQCVIYMATVSSQRYYLFLIPH